MLNATLISIIKNEPPLNSSQMKNKLIYIGLSMFMSFAIVSCYKDTILPDVAVDPDGPAQFVSFKTDLAPMLSTGCGKSGCHNTGGSHKPFLDNPSTSYLQIVNGGFVNTNVPKESKLYTMINGEMREYIPSASDRQKIYDWIRNGAPNN